MCYYGCGCHFGEKMNQFRNVYSSHDDSILYGTTVLVVRKDGKVAMASDGQVTLGNTVVKHTAKKVRRLNDGNVIAGFAGSTADAFALFERFESKIKAYKNDLRRASVELAKDWRTDKILRKLEAMMIVCSVEDMLMISGMGDVIEPEHDVLAIGSGGSFAYSAARALFDNTSLSAREIVEKSLLLAGEICIYTNTHITMEEIDILDDSTYPKVK